MIKFAATTAETIAAAMAMTKGAATAIVHSLSKPSKMPCFSWSIAPALCKVGARLAEVVGSVCSGCYAKKGNYQRYAENMRLCWDKRLAATRDPRWVAAMVRLILGETHFRWFDAGDLQSVNMLAAIVHIAECTPDTKHWLPTRERTIVRQWLQLNPQGFPPNLTVRLSDAMVDQEAPPTPHCAASGVHSDAPPAGTVECQAYTRPKGECADCRLCWDRNVRVSYKLH